MGSWGAPCQGDAVAPDGQGGLGRQHLPRQPVGLPGLHGARPGGDHRRVVPDPPSDNGRDGLRPVVVRRLQGHLPLAARLHLRPPPHQRLLQRLRLQHPEELQRGPLDQPGLPLPHPHLLLVAGGALLHPLRSEQAQQAEGAGADDGLLPQLLPTLLPLLLSLLPLLPPPILPDDQQPPLPWGLPEVSPEERGAGNPLLSPPSPPLPLLASTTTAPGGLCQVQRVELLGRLLHGGRLPHPHQGQFKEASPFFLMLLFSKKLALFIYS